MPSDVQTKPLTFHQRNPNARKTHLQRDDAGDLLATDYNAHRMLTYSDEDWPSVLAYDAANKRVMVMPGDDDEELDDWHVYSALLDCQCFGIHVTKDQVRDALTHIAHGKRYTPD